jgi:hypothetical protein
VTGTGSPQIGTRAPAPPPTKKKIVAGREVSLAPEQLDGLDTDADPAEDTLSRLRQAVADHQKATDDAGADARLAVVLGLCDTYIDRHGDKSGKWSGKNVAAVEDIKAEAMVERGRRLAEARYLQDAYAAGGGSPSPTPMSAQTNKTLGEAHPATQALAQGDTLDTVLGADQATLALIQKYGLTEAEILAVKVYTSDDYKYINPATANSKDWMKAQKFSGKPEDYLKSPQGRAEMKRFLEEGSLHGAMAIAALQKLEDKAGPCYRGDRLTPEQFEERYGEDAPGKKKLPTRTLTNLTSIARKEDSAQHFADSSENPKATISVMTDVDVKHGREIRDLSVYGRGEEEWLLLPGAVLETVSWVELPTGNTGSPAATRWVRVKAREG